MAKVKLNMRGVREVLNDDGVIADCMRRAERIAAAANSEAPESGYQTDPFASDEGRTTRGNRCAVVYTRTNLGKAMQAKHSTLTKAMDAGR
ncbi:MAG: hypothetical protein IJR41_01245 [Atopobiaceae bacterium]|nr:hypothetical protein [Atopobiaceae bacterium]